MTKVKQKEDMYERLDSKEGEKDLYQLMRQKERDGRDVQQVRD